MSEPLGKESKTEAVKRELWPGLSPQSVVEISIRLGEIKDKNVARFLWNAIMALQPDGDTSNELLSPNDIPITMSEYPTQEQISNINLIRQQMGMAPIEYKALPEPHYKKL